MNVETKLQIDFIKGDRLYYKKTGNYIILSNGHVGVYLKDGELKVDTSKMIEFSSDFLDPDVLLKTRSKARITNIARKIRTGDFAILLKSIENDNKCFVNEKYLKMFNGFTELFILSRKDPVLVHRLGKPYGIILPVCCADEELQEEKQ